MHRVWAWKDQRLHPDIKQTPWRLVFKIKATQYNRIKHKSHSSIANFKQTILCRDSLCNSNRCRSTLVLTITSHSINNSRSSLLNRMFNTTKLLRWLHPLALVLLNKEQLELEWIFNQLSAILQAPSLALAKDLYYHSSINLIHMKSVSLRSGNSLSFSKEIIFLKKFSIPSLCKIAIQMQLDMEKLLISSSEMSS